MIRILLRALVLVPACRTDTVTTQPEPPPKPQPQPVGDARDAGPQPLDCTTMKCPTFAEELAQQCSYPGTKVRRATLGRFTVLHAETDPTSVVYTSSEYYFDRTGKLVGRKIFVNEWSRYTEEGLIPTGTRVREADACPPKP
jgi:hypothetical protein